MDTTILLIVIATLCALSTVIFFISKLVRKNDLLTIARQYEEIEQENKYSDQLNKWLISKNEEINNLRTANQIYKAKELDVSVSKPTKNEKEIDLTGDGTK